MVVLHRLVLEIEKQIMRFGIDLDCTIQIASRCALSRLK